MTRSCRLIALVALPLLLGSAAWAEEDPIFGPPDIGKPDTDSSGGALTWDDLSYQPPDLGRPTDVTGGASRGGEKLPVPELLAPRDHAGVTGRAQPSLYWRLEKPTDLGVEFVIQATNAPKPLAKRLLPSPLAAGVHRIDLRQLDVKLLPGVEYEWSVAVQVDPERPSKDLVAQREIRRVDFSAVQLDRIRSAERHRKANILAEGGFWYDAVEAVSREIEAHPGDPGPIRQRDSLLRQVGLAAVSAP
jgi:hypothetical protein